MAVFDATIKDYLTEIDDASLLSWQQECELANAIIENGDPQARDTLVKSNLRLVVNIAKKFAKGKMALADIIEEGNLGLIRAVDSFDPTVGVRFSTYAAWWIKQSIKRALLTDSGPISIPTYMVELVNQYRHTFAQLQSDQQQTPTINQIANEMKLSVKKVTAIQQIIEATTNPVHQNSDSPNQNQYETASTISKQMPEDELINTEELKKAISLLSKIPDREAEVIKLRFGINGDEPLTLKQIGAKLGLTRERVRQLQQSALKQLNAFMSY